MPSDFKIGVMIESFRCGLRGGLQAAANLGVQGVQLYATGGETHFSKLRGPALADLRLMLAEHNLEMAAVCGDFGGHGFQVAEANASRIEDSKRVVELALELNCHVVTTHIGVLPADARHPRYVVMARACASLAQFAASQGAIFAIETGPEPAIVLRSFLDDIGIPKGLGVNFDPANLVMVCREDIPAAVQTLAPYIVHTHAKDGVNRKPVDAEKLYGTFAGDKIDGFCWKDYIQELPLGKGNVPFDAYLSALRQAGYHGYLTIEREAGDNPYQDIDGAVSFLREAMAKENKEIAK